MIAVLDDAVPDPVAYRTAALALPFGDLTIGESVFHGMAVVGESPLSDVLLARFGLATTVSAFRLSPAGQVEPNMVHDDSMMGDWTAILFLNPDPPAGDGTTFFRDRTTGLDMSSGGLLIDTNAWNDPDRWEPSRTIPAAFNRLLVFDAARYHSRALFDNYGSDVQTARLIQIAFGTGALSWASRPE